MSSYDDELKYIEQHEMSRRDFMLDMMASFMPPILRKERSPKLPQAGE